MKPARGALIQASSAPGKCSMADVRLALWLPLLLSVSVLLSSCGGGGSSPAPPPVQIVAAVNASALSFGSTSVGSVSSAQTVVLKNTGTGTLQISGISISPDFKQTNTCIAAGSTGGQLAPGGSCQIAVVFSSLQPGSQSGTLTISDNAPGSPQTVALSGSATAVTITIAPVSLIFGTQLVSTASVAQSVLLSNTSAAAVSFSSISVSGDFRQTNTCANRLPAGNSCAISVTFAPSAVGQRTGTLTISDDAAASPQKVALSGTGATGNVAVTPSSLTFAAQQVGTTSAAQTVTVSNAGSVAVSITGVSASAPYAETNTCIAPGSSSGQLQAGGSCTVSVSFQPAATGTQSGTLTISSNGSAAPLTVALSGTGANGSLTVTPSSLSFGNQIVGTSSAVQTVTLNNNGSLSVNLQSISAGGQFAQTNTCIPSGSSSAQLAVGASCTVSVKFQPTAVGSQTGTLTVADDAAGSPQTMPLSGTGTSLSLAPASISFASQAVDTSSSPQTIAFQNNGTSTITITGISVSGDFSQTSSCIPQGSSSGQVAAGASCSIAVTFTPAGSGVRTGALTVAVNAGGGPLTASLSGQGAGSGSSAVTLSPTVLAFGTLSVGSTTSPQKVTLTNSTSSALTITAITASNDYSQSNTCIPQGSSSGQLSANASCTISVTFSPSMTGSDNGSLTISDSAGNSPQTVPLEGNGSNVEATLSVTPANLVFAAQNVWTVSGAQTVTVTNSGAVAVPLTGIAASGDYMQSNTCIPSSSTSGSLAANSSCTINVQFRPTAGFTRTGRLTVNYGAPGSPQQVGLSGTGVLTTNGSFYVQVVPATACIGASQQQQFSAAVSGNSNTAVSWSVDGVAGGNSTVGTIDNTGLFTPGTSLGAHTIQASSAADSTKFAQSRITVQTGVSDWINPKNPSVLAGNWFQLQGNVCGTSNTALTWYVDNISGGNQTVGTITSDGLYQSPSVPGTHTVSAVSAADPSKTAAITVTVYSTLTVDFGGRAGVTLAIPAGVFGGQLGNLSSISGMATLAQGGFTATRIYARIPDVYATTTPDWSYVDTTVYNLKNAGLHPIIMMAFTPTWLQPSPNPCGTLPASHSVPADDTTWGQLAASYVAHFDQKFPGFVQDYEIWNEPDLNSFFCVPYGNNRVSAYLALYSAAASQMKAQASTDGQNIRVGGPALSNPVGLTSTWITPLVTNSNTAPYVDFVSYHQYLGGTPQVQSGMTWDDESGTQSLYGRTQEPTWGPASAYLTVNSAMSAGIEPNAGSTPIYLSEYDDNSAFNKDCCRSSPVYSPVWNTLLITDLLNSAYGGATSLLARTMYYAASNPPFCLLGTIDSSMDCSTSGGYQPYPQYYAYQLVAGSGYLGLSAGGNVAASVSLPLGQGGLQIAGFYTATRDAVLIVNPTSVAYTNVPVVLQNAGSDSGTGTIYRLDSANYGAITSQPAMLTATSNGWMTSVNIPPYTAMAVGITAP